MIADDFAWLRDVVATYFFGDQRARIERIAAQGTRIVVLEKEVLRLTEAVAFAHNEGCEWPVDPLPPGCVAQELRERPAQVDGRRMAETENTGSVRSTTSAVPNGDAPK